MLVSRVMPSSPSSVTIIKDTANRYFASFVVEVTPEKLPNTNKSVGIDLGLTYFAITSDGEKIENPRYQKKLLNRIRKANRKLSRCKKGSNRRQKAKIKLAKLHNKINRHRSCFNKRI